MTGQRDMQARTRRGDGGARRLARRGEPLREFGSGHAAVYPRTRMTVRDGIAVFHRGGATLWTCRAHYALANFTIDPV